MRTSKQVQDADAREVRKIAKRANVQTGRPRRVVLSALRSKVAFPSTGSTVGASAGNFYSPELSTDFLELPQSADEKRNYYRFFYAADPFVGQAVDLHTELPLSKIRLSQPKAKNKDIADASLAFCTEWAKRIGLLHRMIEIVHDFNLLGEVFVFCEDDSPDMPEDIEYELVREIDEESGQPIESRKRRSDWAERASKWLRKNYHGWTAIRVLPPEQIHMEGFPFTDEKLIELIPDSKTKDVISRGDSGDPYALRVVNSMPAEVVRAIRNGGNIPLNTDSDAGSFVYYMARKKSQYEPRGHSILERCLLPGTLITVERNGIVQQVPVEGVKTDTDLLLTHKGRFCRATSGSRTVKEVVTVLHVEGVEQPLALTSDHRVLRVLEDGREEWVEAGKLREGDTLREAHVVPMGGSPEEINLAEWWSKRGIIDTEFRVRGLQGERTRETRILEVTEPLEGGLAVTFEHDGDSACQKDSIEKMGRLLAWVKALPGPTEATYETVGAVTGLSYKEIQNYAHEFRKRLGLHTESRFLGRGAGKISTWFPLSADAKLWGETVVRTETTDTARIPLEEDFLYLLGTWIGDGDTWGGVGNGFLSVLSVGWTIGKKNPELHTRIMELALRYFGSDCVDDVHPFGKDANRPTTYVRVQDPLLARWFRDTFGKDCYTKTLPRWVFDLPENAILAFLRGVLDTDGCLRPQPTIELTLANKILIDQIHLLCSRVGITTSVKWSQKKVHTWGKYSYEAKDFPKLVCSVSVDVRRWAEKSLKGSKITWVDKGPRKSKFTNLWLIRRVEKVESVAYEGSVYSFDVEGDESLVAVHCVIHNCLRILVYRDKLRQAQTSIASRHMTPIRLIWAEDASASDVDAIREQIELALQDPDYSIVTNFELHWEELGSQQRLLELSGEYEMTDRQLYAGLGVTESLLSGESSYSGDRINLEVINTRYMLLREVLQDMIEDNFLRPMCRRMGFIEKDDAGNETVIVPSLSFTRLALRDNADTFDALFNLYQKGSLDVDVILDLLNIDPHTTAEKLKRDLFTTSDSKFNDVLGGIYGDAGRQLVENSDVVEKIAKYLGLKYEKPAEKAEGRF